MLWSIILSFAFFFPLTEGNPDCTPPTDATCETGIHGFDRYVLFKHYPCDCHKAYYCDENKLHIYQCQNEKVFTPNGNCYHRDVLPPELYDSLCVADPDCVPPSIASCIDYQDGVSGGLRDPCDCNKAYDCIFGDISYGNCGEADYVYVPGCYDPTNTSPDCRDNAASILCYDNQFTTTSTTTTSTSTTTATSTSTTATTTSTTTTTTATTTTITSTTATTTTTSTSTTTTTSKTDTTTSTTTTTTSTTATTTSTTTTTTTFITATTTTAKHECRKADSRGILWLANYGEFAEKHCSYGVNTTEGIAYWYCDESRMDFNTTEPDRSNCVDSWVNGVQDMINDENIPDIDIMQTINENISKANQTSSGGTILNLSEILETLANSIDEGDVGHDLEFACEYVNASNQIFSSYLGWMEISDQTVKMQALSKNLKTIDLVGYQLGRTIINKKSSCGDTTEISYSAVEVQVQTMKPDFGSKQKCFNFQSEGQICVEDNNNLADKDCNVYVLSSIQTKSQLGEKQSEIFPEYFIF